MQKILCDASSLISLADNCMLFFLKDLQPKAEFLIPKGVKHEIVDRPLTTKKFELKAIRINKYLNLGVLKVFDHPGLAEKTKQLTGLANHLLSYKEKNIEIMHEGEAEAIASLKILGEKTLLMDERTTRHLVENIDQLKSYMESRTGLELQLNKSARNELEKELSEIEIIRSVEIFAYAYEKGLLKNYGTEKILEAGLWAMKFSGCSMADTEISEYLKLLG